LKFAIQFPVAAVALSETATSLTLQQYPTKKLPWFDHGSPWFTMVGTMVYHGEPLAAEIINHG